MLASLTIEPAGEAESGICACCGHKSRRVWGFVYYDRSAFASYFVHWTQGHVAEYGATWDIVIGLWGEGTSAADRFSARLCSRHGETSDFMVVDADPAALQGLASIALRRDEIVGRPLAGDIFAVCDAVLAQDARVKAMAEEVFQEAK